MCDIIRRYIFYANLIFFYFRMSSNFKGNVKLSGAQNRKRSQHKKEERDALEKKCRLDRYFLSSAIAVQTQKDPSEETTKVCEAGESSKYHNSTSPVQDQNENKDKNSVDSSEVDEEVPANDNIVGIDFDEVSDPAKWPVILSESKREILLKAGPNKLKND